MEKKDMFYPHVPMKIKELLKYDIHYKDIKIYYSIYTKNFVSFKQFYSISSLKDTYYDILSTIKRLMANIKERDILIDYYFNIANMTMTNPLLNENNNKECIRYDFVKEIKKDLNFYTKNYIRRVHLIIKVFNAYEDLNYIKSLIKDGEGRK